MVTLIVLNIILIIAIVFLLIYFFKNKKYDEKNTCINNKKYDEIENIKNKHNKSIKPERILKGIFITDEEYQKMVENRKSDISILWEEFNKEYEHLKELRK